MPVRADAVGRDPGLSPDNGASIDCLPRTADEAPYRAKHEGSNRIDTSDAGEQLEERHAAPIFDGGRRDALFSANIRKSENRCPMSHVPGRTS